MDSRTEGRLLRLAIARGLLRWEDLDSVADQLPEPGEGPPSGAQWLPVLLEAGRLGPADVARLVAELDDEDALSFLAKEGPIEEMELTQEIGTVPKEAARQAPRAVSFPPELAFLARWERYRIKRLVGTGGMGTVYKAFDPSLGRNVALKFLHRNDPEQAERFLREARSQARISHPNVCQVHEVGQVEGRPYIAMQYVKGRSLSEMKARLPVESRIRLIRDVALAVHAAHKNGLIHRDLKPGNILVEAGDAGGLHPYVVDFGLAQDQNDRALTRTGMITGTPGYLSPEQAQGKTLDRRSDIYGLGVVLYEILSGRPPFTADNPAAVLVRLLQEEPEPLRKLAPAIPRDLETIVMKCLEKDRARRYDSARALAEDLDRYLEGEPIEARPAGWGYRFGKRVRKHKALSIVTAAASVALVVVGLTSLQGHWQAQEREQLAQDFGQRVAELESDLRFEAHQPPHDISPRKTKLLREMEEIRTEMKRLGPPAEGPGHYALGRGYLALHQYEIAREHLERAWKAGQRGPREAAALGRAFGFLYERALVEAGRSRGGEDAAAARREIESTFRRPALSYLKEGVGEAGPTDPYLAALIAFYERRYGEAVAKARQADQQPGFYEGAQLEAEVYAMQGDEAANGGRYEEALRFYDHAGEVYRKLLTRVGSDASVHAGECLRQARYIEAEGWIRAPAEQRVADALAACDLALQVDPELGEALVQKSKIYRLRAAQKGRRGVDPRSDLSAAVAMAQQAISLNPRDALAYNVLAVALRVQAHWERGKGLDPSASLNSAVRAAEKAVEMQPERASSRSDLATVYLEKVRSGRGFDPYPVIEQALASCRQAIRLNPQYLPAYTNLSNAWKALAEHQIDDGREPGASLAKAITASQRAVVLNPQSPSFRNNLGNAYLTLAEYQMEQGTDPRPALAQARQSYESAIEIDPSYQYAVFNLAWTDRCLAESLFERGEDPSPAIRRARAALESSLQINPQDADSHIERAQVELIAARFARQQNQAPEPLFRAAEAALRKALELNPDAEVQDVRDLLAQYRR